MDNTIKYSELNSKPSVLEIQYMEKKAANKIFKLKKKWLKRP